MKAIPFPLRPGEIDVLFRFGIKAARDMERAAGCKYSTLFQSGKQIETICLLTCFALRHDEPAMTVDKATDLVENYVDKGGNIVTLYETLEEAMSRSGVYGPAPAEDGEAHPSTPTAEVSATP